MCLHVSWSRVMHMNTKTSLIVVTNCNGSVTIEHKQVKEQNSLQ